MDSGRSERSDQTLSTILYAHGDATARHGPGRILLVHICNDVGKWGAGFVLAISRRWKEPQRAFLALFRDEMKPKLGDVQFVDVEPEFTVANMIGQHGIRRSSKGTPPIRYEAVETALERVAQMAKERGARVQMPRIGCGLAGGTWDHIEPLIERTLIREGINVTVYDFT